ncbi:DUF448 domain-containing protein [Helicobacter cappadocius]|uniref:DUF448 domain-containing protein n=1 Tax=Helicobacter cappadocius TaxID=3063998 RepID=A0AA90PKL5_9HELI|nr:MULTISPECIES: DUF448 domain-containing protein [unclassified Helicobacter]MDO7253305.1 DUF448 domain-containing protein [Helicobacter sp. faydin-H75]MDP2539265.1 DUF448 domain-containing protein [Helicobacter sp. faydin-H76]
MKKNDFNFGIITENSTDFKKFSSQNSVRMCVCCRKRFSQDQLLRLKADNAKIVFFDGSGRSFYICEECIGSDKIIGSLIRVKNTPKDKNIIREHIKEIRNKWQKLD